jgi:Transposase DDE domain
LPSLTQDPRFGSQADQQTDKESNPHGYNSIGTKYVDYGLGANPNPAREGLFRKEEFHYDAQNDVFICPGNQQLHPRYRSTGGELDRIYYFNRDACRHCELKSRCTINPYRQVARSIDEEVLDRMETRLKANPGILRQRREIMEHPFGSIKQWMNQGAFLMRGLEKVRAEFSLTALAYNMTRVL